MRTRRKTNKHGLYFKIQGNYLFVNRKNKPIFMSYIKWINPDYITPEMVEEDFNRQYPFVHDTKTVEFSDTTSIELPEEPLNFQRTNKHGVVFDDKGAHFTYEGTKFFIGLPPLSDLSHAYTPELLINVLWGHGSFSHKSQCWMQYRGDKKKRSEELRIEGLF